MNARQTMISELVEEVLEKLAEANYRDETVVNYRRQYDDLARYAALKGKELYSLELSRSYLFDEYGIDTTAKIHHSDMSSKERCAKSKIRILDDYFLHGAIISHPNGRIKTEAALPDALRELLYGYVSDCEKNEQSSYGIKGKRGRLRQFLSYLARSGRDESSKIDALSIADYVKVIASHHEKSIAADLSTLRSFFRWLYHSEKTTCDLSQLVPKATKYNYPEIPCVWEKEDVILLLGSIDRANPIGKRDFAALSLAAKLGMRTVDIKYLRLSNLDFANKKISFAQHKTGAPATFPMTDEIGWALADWLKNGRPVQCVHDYVFSHVQYPFSQVGNYNERIAKYIRSAGICVDGQKHHGMHSLRHTLASALLEQGVALPLISDVLGHMDPKSTSIYLHCDIEGLRACAINPDAEADNA